ncbi:hypothetical protein PYW07_000656 [Mythimna separata]|uniref:Uncharacterized protein n=1 Tax=Mythimna separata TaxID=271217 RepID=A0AAD7Z467_MYTSE|nr:hypothetical protein PYW07_000656 [Mythimna separata]
MFGMWLRVQLTNINQASGGARRRAARCGRPLQPHPHGVYRSCATLNGRSSVASVDCRPAQRRVAEKGPTQCLLRHPQHHTNMKILPLLILVACVACSARAQDDERPAPARGLLKRGGLAKGKPTTTTTPAPQEEVEYEDEGDYPAEGEQQEASTEAPSSTTEGKKLVGSGVRPFRSNTDLLEILKRKRAQAAEAKLNAPPTSTSTAAQDSLDPTKITYNNKSKKRFNNAPVTREVASDDAPPAPKPSRGRFGRPATRSVQETEEEPASEAAAPPARSGRTFRRGGN